jgi:hypothetical protein
MNWQEFFKDKTRGGFKWRFVGILNDVREGPEYIIEVYTKGFGFHSTMITLGNDGKMWPNGRETEYDLIKEKVSAKEILHEIRHMDRKVIESLERLCEGLPEPSWPNVRPDPYV